MTQDRQGEPQVRGRSSLPRAEAIKLMEERGEKYKVEHIGDLPEDARITFYQQGDYIDMCVGPHLTLHQGAQGL